MLDQSTSTNNRKTHQEVTFVGLGSISSDDKKRVSNEKMSLCICPSLFHITIQSTKSLKTHKNFQNSNTIYVKDSIPCTKEIHK